MPARGGAGKGLVTGLTAFPGRATTRLPHGEDTRLANHASAKKRARQTVKRTARNRHIRTGVRTCIKRVRAAVQAGDSDAAKKALAQAVSQIDGAVSKGIYHRKTGSRYIARLTHQVNEL